MFISYVSEDRAQARRLAENLRGFGIDVWLDRDALVGGDRWASSIREAISRGGGFLACFSAQSEVRDRSHMREEITLAIEELRLRSTSSTWFIPVLLDGTPIRDDREIGAGHRLSDIQFVDMAAGWDRGVQQIITALLQQNSPEERARLADDLATAQALESLAVAEGGLADDPFDAFRSLEILDRVSKARSTAFVDVIASRLSGIASVHDLDEVPNRFGATTFPENPIALSRSPRYVAWSGRTGAVAAARLSSPGSATILRGSFGYSADVFIDPQAETVAACYINEGETYAWRRISPNEWLPITDLSAVSWDALLNVPWTSRYAVRAGRPLAVKSSFEGHRLLDLADRSERLLPIEASWGGVAISRDGAAIIASNRAEWIVLRLQGGEYAEVNRFDGSLVTANLFGDRFSYSHVRFTAAGEVLFVFADASILLRDPFAPVTRESMVRFDGGGAIALGGDGFAALSPSSRASTGRAIRVGGPGIYRGDAVVAASDIGQNGLEWLAGSPDGEWIAVVDERGRVLTTDRSNPGPVSSLRTSVFVPPDGLCVVRNGNLYSLDSGSLITTPLQEAASRQSTNVAVPVPSGARPMSLDAGARHLSIAFRLDSDVHRVVYELDYVGRPGQDPLGVRVETFEGQINGMNLGTRFLDDGRAAWRSRDGGVDLVELTASLQSVMRFEFETRDQDRVWDVSARTGLAFVLSFSDDVRVFSTTDGEQVATLTGTGGGEGGDWGDAPADIRVIGRVVVSAKRSGSIARWSAADLEPLGRPLLVSPNVHLDLIDALDSGSAPVGSVVVGSRRDGCVIVRDISDPRASPRVFSGMGRTLGTLGRSRLATLGSDREVRIWDMSPESVASSVRDIGARSSRAALVP